MSLGGAIVVSVLD